MQTRILVIDDDNAVRSTICENLIDLGYEVTDTPNGEEALQRIRSDYIPDVVITDIVMPQKEGLEIIMEIKRDFPDVKLIAVSGGGGRRTADFLHLAKMLGADGTVPKPLDIDYLHSIITGLVGR